MPKRIIDTREPRKKRVRPEHNFPLQTRQLLVELCSPRLDADGGELPPLVDVDDLRVVPSAPSRATIFKWLAGDFTDNDEPTSVVQHDFSSVLNEWQELVVVGFCLFTLSCHRAVTLELVLDFVRTHFREDLSQQWASLFFKRHHFAKHRPAALPVAYAVHDTLDLAVSWLRDNQSDLCNAVTTDALFSLDQISFWDNAVCASSFSPVGGYVEGLRRKTREVVFPLFFCALIGEISSRLVMAAHPAPAARLPRLRNSGQPFVLTENAGAKHIVYSAFAPDGTCLVLVIFTGQQPPPCDDNRDGRGWYLSSDRQNHAYVHYIEGLSQSSTRTTEIYLETLQNNRFEQALPRDASFVLDRAPWHISAEAAALWNQYHFNVFVLPPTTGKWLNPNDQAIHREIRRQFNRLQLINPRHKVRNIIDAYYAVSEETVRASWRHTYLLRSGYEEHLRKEAARGFRAGVGCEDHFEAANEAWEQWFRASVRRPRDVLSAFNRATVPGSALDGQYWIRYGTSHK